MSTQNVFLGQVNDFSDMMANACAMLRPKPGRDVVIRGYVSEARATGRLTPATSGKLRGLVQFYGSSIHGQIAKGGLQPLAERQYSQKSNMTDTLDKALQYIDVMTQLAPHRCVHLVHDRRRVTAWSDAEYDPSRPELGGGLGYLMRVRGHVVGGAARVDTEFIKKLLPRKQQIGQLEALVPLIALFNERDLFSGTDVLWGIDNTSAEASLVRGYSTRADTANIVTSIHILAARIDCRIFFFHVDSESNPSDGLSRDGLTDMWSQRMASQFGWNLHNACIPPFDEFATLPLELLTRCLAQAMDDGVWRHNDGQAVTGL